MWFQAFEPVFGQSISDGFVIALWKVNPSALTRLVSRFCVNRVGQQMSDSTASSRVVLAKCQQQQLSGWRWDVRSSSDCLWWWNRNGLSVQLLCHPVERSTAQRSVCSWMFLWTVYCLWELLNGHHWSHRDILCSRNICLYWMMGGWRDKPCHVFRRTYCLPLLGSGIWAFPCYFQSICRPISSRNLHHKWDSRADQMFCHFFGFLDWWVYMELISFVQRWMCKVLWHRRLYQQER